MFQGLKIAFKQQKKLLLIFFFAIFLPSVSLSIFGIIALQNEKFRLAKQIENEQLQFASDTKGKIETKLLEIEERLENLAVNPSFRQKNFPVVIELITSLFEKDSLVGTIFLLYKNEEPLFPLFQTGFDKSANIAVLAYDSFLKQQIKNAEDAEFIRSDYLKAASIYNQVFLQSSNQTIKARMLNHIARNLMKAGKFSRASDNYSEIITDYPDERTESGLPIELHAKLQKTECLNMLGDNGSAVKNDLDVYEDLLVNRWNLNESQFKTYSSIVNERLTGLLPDSAWKSTIYKSRFELLKEQYLYNWSMAGNQ